jgi:hypothetical protein
MLEYSIGGRAAERGMRAADIGFSFRVARGGDGGARVVAALI